MPPSHERNDANAAGRAVKILFSEAQLAQRVEALAREVCDAIEGDFVVVCLLKGAFVFAADLLRAMHRLGAGPAIEFLQLSSYGARKESSGEVRLIGEIPPGLTGRQVLLVDDILDTGRSLSSAARLLREAGVARLWICVLLDKPSRRVVEATADFVGFTIPDVFVVGYGIDYAENYRGLPCLGAIE
jgi:hypoxanthine phosphoribosyltransferase